MRTGAGSHAQKGGCPAELGDGAPVGDEDHARLLALREAIREALRANTGEIPDPAALDRLNAEIARVRLQPAFDPAGRLVRRAAAAGADGVVAELLSRIADAAADGTWGRLKACRRPECRWAFWDASRDRGGRWCTMAVCGNRAKVAAYRHRRAHPTFSRAGSCSQVSGEHDRSSPAVP